MKTKVVCFMLHDKTHYVSLLCFLGEVLSNVTTTTAPITTIPPGNILPVSSVHFTGLLK